MFHSEIRSIGDVQVNWVLICVLLEFMLFTGLSCNNVQLNILTFYIANRSCLGVRFWLWFYLCYF